MFSHKHKAEIEKKTQEAAEARGQAKAMTAVGAVGGAGWAGLELLSAAGDMALFSSGVSGKTWRTIGFVTGAVGLGALIYAGVKHTHAHKAEQEKQKLQGQVDWQERIEQARALSASMQIS
jgi:hypothetical protein